MLQFKKQGKGLKTITVGSPITNKEIQNLKIARVIYPILLDSGSDGNIAFITEEELRRLRVTQKAYPNTWGTSNGTFKNNRSSTYEYDTS